MHRRPRGYGPRELLLLHPAIYFYYTRYPTLVKGIDIWKRRGYNAEMKRSKYLENVKKRVAARKARYLALVAKGWTLQAIGEAEPVPITRQAVACVTGRIRQKIATTTQPGLRLA